MTTTQEARELANWSHVPKEAASALESLAEQVEALTAALDTAKAACDKNALHAEQLAQERDRIKAWSESAWSRGNACGYASNADAMKRMEEDLRTERVDANKTNEMLTEAVEKAEADRDQWEVDYNEARLDRELLIREREALKADAERYRWLRNRLPGNAYRIAGVIYSDGGAGVDAAIDSARAAS